MDSADFDEENDNLELTALEVFQRLLKVWLNEKFAPELLVHESDLINCVLEELNKIETDTKRFENGTFEGCLKKLEVERIRYMVSNYTKIRIQKIERFIFNIFEEEEKRRADKLDSKLSPQERTYATGYRSSLENYLKENALQYMEGKPKELLPEKMAVQPNFDQFVFCRVERRVPDVTLANPNDETLEEQFDLEVGSQQLIPYKAVALHVKNGDLHLI